MIDTILEHFKKVKKVTKSESVIGRTTNQFALTSSFITLKGGVGKTTLSIEVCKILKERGEKVLAVDLDPQANMTLALTEESFDSIEKNFCFYDLLNQDCHISSCLIKTKDGIDLIPSTSQNSLINQSRDPKMIERSKRIFNLLKLNYDYIIVDCTPTTSVSHALAIISSDIIISPILVDAYSLQGLHKTIHDIKDVCRKFNNTLKHKVIFNKLADSPLILEKSAQIQDLLPENMYIGSVGDWSSTDMPGSNIKKQLELIGDFLQQEKDDLDQKRIKNYE